MNASGTRNNTIGNSFLDHNWEEVIDSDDSLSDFIVEKKPKINERLEILNALGDVIEVDSDEEEPREKNLSKVLGDFEESLSYSSFLKTKITNSSTSFNSNFCRILKFDNEETIPQTKTKKSINKIVFELRKKVDITIEKKRELFVNKAIDLLKELDVIILDFKYQQLHKDTTNDILLLRGIKQEPIEYSEITTPVKKKKSVQDDRCSEVRRSARARKNCIRTPVHTVADVRPGFLKKLERQVGTNFITKTDTGYFEKHKRIEGVVTQLKNKIKTVPSPKQHKRPATNAMIEDAKERGRCLKVILENNIFTTPSPSKQRCSARVKRFSFKNADNFGVESGFLTLKPNEERRMKILSNQNVIYTLAEGEAMVTVNDLVYILHEGGDVMVEAGRQCSIKNIDHRKLLMMRFYKIRC